MVEGRCCNSSTSIITPCTDCLAVLVEHISGNTEATNTSVTGVAVVETTAVLEPSIALVGIAAGVVPVADPGIELMGLGTELLPLILNWLILVFNWMTLVLNLILELVLVFFVTFVLVELRLVPRYQ